VGCLPEANGPKTDATRGSTVVSAGFVEHKPALTHCFQTAIIRIGPQL